MKKRLLIITIISILAISLFGCNSSGKYVVKKMSKEDNGNNYMEMTYEYFDGYKYKKVEANKGNILELSLNVTTKGGKLNILVLNDKEEEIYSNYDLNGNINEKINIDEDGKYMIKIEGDKHEGSYDISWKLE
ncbi:MAG: hypothetical protein ACI33J_06845 [Clostridium sp.]